MLAPTTWWTARMIDHSGAMDRTSVDVVTIAPQATVAEAAAELQKHHVSALVVVEAGAVVGLLTERDLLQVIIDGDDPSAVPVRRRMATDVVTVTPDTDPMEARELMGRHAVRHLPVIDGGRVVGLVEQTEPRVGLNFGGRRLFPDAGAPTVVLEDFRGPYADGPPDADLLVDAPSLEKFGFTEVRRGLTIAFVLTWSVLRSLLRRRFDLVVRRRAVPGWWDAASSGAVDAFEVLGPAFVKLGQIMASSPGVFPPPLADACQRTLDEVPPFDSATARRIIEEDLGHPPERLFRFFDDKPLSAASIGQVHACVLPDGRQAVLKLQRPGVRDLMTADLRILWRIAKLAEKWDWLSSADPVAIIEDTAYVNFQELVPALEAKRQMEFRGKIWTFGDNEGITAPEVYWNWCGPRIICMERMTGTPLDEFEEMARRGIDGELMLRRGAKVWIESVCVHGPFHGDMHAGNIWFMPDGRASFLDFGIMGELAPEYRDVVKDILYTCMIDGDFTRIARAYRRVGVFPPDVGTDEELGMRLAMILGPMLEAGIGGMNLGEMLKMSIDLMDNYGAKGPRELVLIAKQLAYMERYAKGMAPDYQIIQDLYLIKNVFPEAVAAKAAEQGIELPA
jgi:predicted unusual protein kinase regulating ubiquinone biosynthesis (AarF/ABC1/UbiB family)/CBS domain-containing protein